MKKQLLQLTIAGIYLLGTITANAQPDIQIQWQKTIGGNSQENLSTIAETHDGGYVFCGWSMSDPSGEKTDTNRGPALTADGWVVKTDAAGIIEWDKTFGGNDGDYLMHISSTWDSGYLVTGYSKSNQSGEKSEDSRGGSNDYWILKLNSDGDIEWDKTYGGFGGDIATKGFQTRDGGYIVAGYSQSDISVDKTVPNRGGNIPTAGYDYWLLKLDSSGNIIWQQAYGGDKSDQFSDIVATYDGGFLLGGCSSSGISGEKTSAIIGANDIWLVKTDSMGNFEWDKAIGGDAGEAFTSIDQTSDSGYIFAIQSFSGISGDKTDTNRGTSDYWIVKTDNQATIQWQRTFGTTGYDWASGAFQSEDGGYFVHGYAASSMTGDKTDSGYGGSDYWTIKLDDTGAVEWQKTLGGDAAESIFSINLAIQTADKGFLVGGYSSSGISGVKTDSSRNTGPLAFFFSDFWVVKLGEVCHQTDTTFISGEVCSAIGFETPWGTTVYDPGTYSYNFERSLFGSHCDSTVVVTLAAAELNPVITIDTLILSTTMPYATYQWMLNGTVISGATGAEYTVSQNGDYTVAVTDEAGCPDTSAIYKVTNVTDIHTLPSVAQQITTYPNPASDLLHIQSPVAIDVVLTDLAGKTIREVKKAHIVSLKGLANGIYLLRIKAADGSLIDVKKISRQEN